MFFRKRSSPPEQTPPVDETEADAPSRPESADLTRNGSRMRITSTDSAMKLGDGLDFDDRREGGRLPIDRIGCDVGRVVDLSRHGMRIERPHRMSLNALHVTRLVDPEFPEEPITVSFRCVWEQRLSRKAFLYGIAFVELADEDRQRLAHLAASCRRRRVM